MSLTEATAIDLIEVVGQHTIQVRTVTRILRDGVAVGDGEYHRHVVTPDSDLSQEDPRVRAIAEAAFTDEVLAAWGATKAAIG